jgi:hypothetical protein
VPNDHRDYTISKAEFDTYHEFKVRANVTGSQNHTVQVMKDEHRGHRATSCTCGVPQITSVPCRHIVAVAKSGKGEGLNLVTAMPYFWSTRWWRNQFPQSGGVCKLMPVICKPMVLEPLFANHCHEFANPSCIQISGNISTHQG